MVTRSWLSCAGPALLLTLVSVMSASGQVFKWTGYAGLGAYSLALFAFALLAGRLPLAALWKNKYLMAGLWAALLILAVSAFLFIYPISHSGRLGPGTDRDEAIRLAWDAFFQGHYPYYPRTHLGMPISPMPGALLLALPFYLIHDVALQNLLWIPLFVLLCWRLFPTRKQGLLFICVCMFGNPSFMQDFVTGGDFSANLIYVSLATLAMYRGFQASDWRFLTIAALALGVTLAWHRGQSTSSSCRHFSSSVFVLALRGPAFWPAWRPPSCRPFS